MSHADQTAAFLVIGTVAGGVLLLSLGIMVGMLMRHSRKSRELLHTERMKALELGQPASFSDPDKLREKYAYSTFWIAFWIGAGVPAAAAWAAAYVMIQPQLQELGIVIAMWSSVAVVSIASVVCATVLMVSARRMPVSVERTAPRSSAAGDVR